MEWYKMFTIDRNEMCRPVDAVNMDDAYSALMLLIKLWAHQPHPSVFIWLVPNTIEPVYNGAWVIGASEVEREEGEDPHDLQAAHRVCFWVHIHECTVIPWTFISPDVTEFVPLHDIPYILLSPDGGPYFSIDEFLASPDRYPNPSTFVPDSSHI